MGRFFKHSSIYACLTFFSRDITKARNLMSLHLLDAFYLHSRNKRCCELVSLVVITDMMDIFNNDICIHNVNPAASSECDMSDDQTNFLSDHRRSSTPCKYVFTCTYVRPSMLKDYESFNLCLFPCIEDNLQLPIFRCTMLLIDHSDECKLQLWRKANFSCFE